MPQFQDTDNGLPLDDDKALTGDFTDINESSSFKSPKLLPGGIGMPAQKVMPSVAGLKVFRSLTASKSGSLLAGHNRGIPGAAEKVMGDSRGSFKQLPSPNQMHVAGVNNLVEIMVKDERLDEDEPGEKQDISLNRGYEGKSFTDLGTGTPAWG